MIRVSVKGLQQIQRANLMLAAVVKPSGGLGRAVYILAADALGYAAANTHVDTGALRASHRLRQEGPARWRIYLDPSARNPRSQARTSIYGPIEHSRGADHAFYERTYRNGRSVASRAASYLRSQLP